MYALGEIRMTGLLKLSPFPLQNYEHQKQYTNQHGAYYLASYNYEVLTEEKTGVLDAI